MEKIVYSVSLHPEIVNQVKAVQLNIAGCSNLSAITEMLLIEWLKQFKEVQNE